MANEKGGWKDEVIPVPSKTKVSLHIAAPSLRLIPASCPHVGHGSNSTLEAPKEGLGRAMSGGGGPGGKLSL